MKMRLAVSGKEKRNGAVSYELPAGGFGIYTAGGCGAAALETVTKNVTLQKNKKLFSICSVI